MQYIRKSILVLLCVCFVSYAEEIKSDEFGADIGSEHLAPKNAMGNFKIYDPIENFNREMYTLHFVVYDYVLSPTLDTYIMYVPESVRGGISRFADNISEPLNLVNHIIQMDMEAAGTNTVRFLINTTIGLLGVFDVASVFGIQKADTNMNITLGYYGIGSGAYLFIPVVQGPSSVRGVSGFVINQYINPITYIINPAFGVTMGIVLGFTKFAEQKESIDTLVSSSADGYVTLRTGITIFSNNSISRAQNGNTTGYYLVKYPLGLNYPSSLNDNKK